MASTPGLQIANFFAGDPARRDGARVAAKDLDGDPFADLVVAVPDPDGRRVVGFRGADLAGGRSTVSADYSTAFDPLLSGVFVGWRRARHCSRLPASNASMFGGGAVRLRYV